jgi:hypothetical protein
MSFDNRLGIAGVLLALLGIALMYLAPQRKEFGWISLLIAVVLVAWWVYFEAGNWLLRKFQAAPVITTTIIGIIGGTVIALVFFIVAKNASFPDSKSVDHSANPSPDVSLRFVYPKSPALMLMNSSDALARDIKWTVYLWNQDLPERDEPLPIPIGTFDWLKPNQKGGPQNLFGSATVAPLIKQGDHLFGSASVNCPTCSRGRTYIVYIVYGEGGWVAEVEREKSGNPFIPPNARKETREAYFKSLEETTAAESRIPIAESPWDSATNM